MGRSGRREKEGAWPLLGGEGRQKEGRGTEGGNKERKKRGGTESWNRAAEWLRPALFILLVIAP